MAARRYWRAVGLEAYGTGDLELSEFHLLVAGGRVDAPATLTASIAPDVSGTLANLHDDVLTTSARWSGQAVQSLLLTWDFGGSPVDVDDIRLAGHSNARFLLIVKIQWSDDAATWEDLTTLAGITWPGAVTKTSSSAGVIVRNAVKGRSAPSDAPEVFGLGPAIAYGAIAPVPTVEVIGSAPAIVYGIPSIEVSFYFGVETGAVKDSVSGVLGRGTGRVRGTVAVKGTPNAPLRRRVRLFRSVDNLLMREIWSDPVTGAYDFSYVDELQTFTVISFDHTLNYRAVVADNLTPELMP